MAGEQATTEQTEAAKVAPLIDPNDFQLSGDGVTISYSTTSFTGTPRFHYRDATRDLDFSGDEIETASSPVGTLVTVTLEPNNDAREIRLTLIIPVIKLRNRGETVAFTAIAIETTDRSLAHVAPPGPSGVLQTYRVHKLRGEARQLDF